jgi:hypothetical protein
VPERLDRVAIATSREVIELSWASRDSLLHEIRNLGAGAKPIRSAFEAVGASRPVELSPADQTTLFSAIEQWADSVTVAVATRDLAAALRFRRPTRRADRRMR